MDHRTARARAETHDLHRQEDLFASTLTHCVNIVLFSRSFLVLNSELLSLRFATPHKAQKALVVRKLLELFPKANPKAVFESVDTVEQFQGGERDMIIVSFGVGDIDIIEGEGEFLLQLERTNVAISRARAKGIVLMPKSLAYHLPTDEKAAETSIALKSYLDEFCVQRKAVSVEFGGEKRNGEVRWR